MTETLTHNLHLEAALAHARRGWRVFPLRPGTRLPAWKEWQERAILDPAAIESWWSHHPDHGIGIATGQRSNLLVLDVDVKDGTPGAESLAELEGMHGPLDTVEAITGTHGRHLFFKYPHGHEIGNSAGYLAEGLDVRARKGYVVAVPTVNAKTGLAYTWDVEKHPDDIPLAEVPPWLIAALTVAPKAERIEGPRATFEQAGVLARDRFNLHPGAEHEVAALLASHGWQEDRPDREGRRYFTRPGKRLGDGHGATLNGVAPGVLRVFTSGAPPFLAETSYDPFDVLRLLVHAGDEQATDAQLVALGWGQSMFGTGLPDLGEATVAPTATDGLHLPESFWQERPVLTHIRQAAHARRVGADAVLGGVLARVAAFTPHTLDLPPIVGEPMGLTFFAASVGPSSAGKSAGYGVARSLIPSSPPRVVDGLPVGSGEGFVEALFEMRPDPDDEKGKRLIKTQVYDGAVFNIDEGQALADLGARSGSTIMPTLRSAFTHGTLGATNASAERKRLLHGHEYVYGVVMGIQPEKAAPLLSDAAGGTPQRFLWLMATDPAAPQARPEWPGPLTWAPPGTEALSRLPESLRGGCRHRALIVAPEVVAEVDYDRWLDQRGRAVDEGDAHRNLVRLKTSAVLALLDRRVEVTADDWRLAGIVVDTSRAVRLSVEASLRSVAKEVNVSRAKRDAERELVIADTVETKALTSGARSAALKVAAHAGSHAEGSCTRNCITRAISGRARKLVTVDEILAEALRLEWVAEASSGRFIAGKSAPS